MKGILDAALDLAPQSRAAFVERACAHDPALRSQVDVLLAAGDCATDELRPIDDVPAALIETHVAAASQLGRVIAGYRLVDVIGVGGMGIVYRAVAERDARAMVAIKLVRREACTADLQLRFRRERELLAVLDHANIAKLISAGTTESGTPFLVMELIDGEPIDRYCERRALALADRLALFRRVCAAVHYAHQNLVVHRDLKPSNVLITASGEPKLVDFGIAKLVDASAGVASATQTLAMVMTPQYASPEQIRGEPVTTASDVYALGLLLYEIVTSARPYQLDGLSRAHAERVICDCEPMPPSRRRGCASGDLDSIVLKALSKRPGDRYSSADQLGDDVARLGDGLPVLAHRQDGYYALRKWLRRHRLAVTLAVTFVIVIAGIAVVAATFAARLAREKQEATVAREEERDARDAAERVSRFLTDLLASASAYRRGGELTVLELLESSGSRVDAELFGQPAVAADVHLTIATTYLSLWLPREAEQHLRTALDRYRTCFGATHEKVGQCLVWLGYALSYQDEEQALAVQEEGLRVNRAVGAKHATADSLAGVAYALFRSAQPARFHESEELFEEAAARLRSVHGDCHPSIARCLHGQAAMYRAWGRLENSEALFRTSLEMSRKSVGNDHPFTIECLQGYAECLMALGRFDQAEPLLEQALVLTRKRLGEWWTVGDLTRLGNLRRKRGDGAGATAFLDRALRIHADRFAARESYGTRGVACAADVSHCGDLIATMRGERAPASFDWPSYARTLGAVADLMIDTAQPASAETIYREVIRILRCECHAPHWRVSVVESRLATSLAMQLESGAALELARSSEADLVNALGAEHGQVIEARRRSAEVAAIVAASQPGRR